jgi:hypothetical protein
VGNWKFIARMKGSGSRRCAKPPGRYLQPSEANCVTTTRRLGEAAASTNFHAGDKLSIPHKTFCGATAAVAPNRQLCAGIFSFFMILLLVFL